MSTARWEDADSVVDPSRVQVMPRGGDYAAIPLGGRRLVTTLALWRELNAAVEAGFSTITRQQVPLPRTDNVKPTDYSSVNCSGACYCGEDE